MRHSEPFPNVSDGAHFTAGRRCPHSRVTKGTVKKSNTPSWRSRQDTLKKALGNLLHFCFPF